MEFLKKVVQVRSQVIAIICSIIIVSGIAYLGLHTLRDLEKEPTLMLVTPSKIAKWGKEPKQVAAGFHIVNFHDFELMSNKFLLNGIVWFEFDPKDISLDKINQFSFENGDITEKSKPMVYQKGDKLFVEYDVKLKLTSNLTYHFFPLDDHRIFIRLINTSISPQNIIFTHSNKAFSRSNNLFTPGWKIMGSGMHTGYTRAQINIKGTNKIVRYPRADFYINFRRSGYRLVLLILLPLFLLFFISLFAFIFDPKKHSLEIRSMASGAIAAMIAYRFVIQTMSPNVGYFMLSDHLFTIFLVFAFIEFVLAVIMIQAGELTRNLANARGIAFILFHVVFIITWYYLIFF